MIYQSREYINYESERQYRLELTLDLLGDITVAKYYGSHREVFVQASLPAAKSLFDLEHKKRINRNYDLVGETDYESSH